MQFDKIKNKGQAQLFNNSVMEYLTKTHPLVIWGLYLPIIIYFLWHFFRLEYSVMQGIIIFFSGIFFWTFFEYIMHRYVFHWSAQSEKMRHAIYILHGNHHEYPRDKERLFMPPLPSLIISSTLFFIFYFLMKQFAFAFFPGFILGYLLYGSIHFAIHAWKPPSMFKFLWRHHHLHHYKSDDKGFGVSSPFWDIIFGTNFKAQKTSI